MRTLLLGFGPFLEIRDNHSARIVQTLATACDGGVEAQVLPVEFAVCAEAVPRLISDSAPDNVLVCGVARRASRLELECLAINTLHGEAPDSAGRHAYNERVVADGPEAYRSTLQLPHWEKALNAEGIAAALSYHAGTYVCNQTYYLAAHAMHARTGHVPVALVHVPPLPGQLPSSLSSMAMSYEQILAGARLCLSLLRAGPMVASG